VASDERTRGEFEGIALPLMNALYSTALYLTRDPDAAADLLQDTMLRAYRFWHRFEPGSNCKAWLMTILYNVFRNEYRSRQRQPTAVELEETHHSPGTHQGADPLADPAERVAFDVLDDEVREALHRLPDSFLEVVVLVDLQELTYEEAAAVVGCPVGTIRSRLSRARQALHQALWQYAKNRRIVD